MDGQHDIIGLGRYFTLPCLLSMRQGFFFFQWYKSCVACTVLGWKRKKSYPPQPYMQYRGLYFGEKLYWFPPHLFRKLYFFPLTRHVIFQLLIMPFFSWSLFCIYFLLLLPIFSLSPFLPSAEIFSIYLNIYTPDAIKSTGSCSSLKGGGGGTGTGKESLKWG